MSADGRYVAFASGNVALVHDRLTGVTEGIGPAVAGPEVWISGNGRYVAFSSNGIAGDTTPFSDVFVHDRVTGSDELVSVGSDGTQGDGASGLGEVAVMSADGRYVVFESEATNLVAGDTNTCGSFVPGSCRDVFVRDRVDGRTERISVASDGSQADGPSGGGDSAISGDGRYVVFRSGAANLVAGTPAGLFLRDRLAGTTELVDANGSMAAVSANGRYVVFGSDIDEPSAGDANGAADVLVRDRVTGQAELVSVASDGTQGNANSEFPVISDDGRYVAFTSSAGNLVPGDANGDPDAFLRDRQTGSTTRVSVSSGGGEGNGFEVAISADGRYVAFEAWAPLEPADDNGTDDVYVHDVRSESVTLTAAAGATVTSDTEGDGATPFDLIEATVTTPSAGSVSIHAAPATAPPSVGFVLLGQQVQLTAPVATATDPLVVGFRLDASLVPADLDETTLQVFKDGALVPVCSGMQVAAAPDPCIAHTAVLADGDVELTVQTSTASLWTFGARLPYAFTGFLDPVDNPPTLNAVSAGRAIPVKFSLNGDQGLDIFAPGYPRSRRISCDSTAVLDPIEQTIAAGSSSLSYDPSSDRYTYVWKTDKAWATTCRQLIVKLSDQREYPATFTFMK